MYIKSLSLKNIRSYESSTIKFTGDSSVLSGDIGSGKTTILMALEFCLFGVLRGKVSPTEILRHGSDFGEVSLSCEIQGSDVFIKRSLKRSSGTVVQLPGIINIDGVSDELTPTDLKAKVLTLLGYPSSLIAKSTNLFRYTVYTPQEQVKSILFETTETRKDIIRNIFSIDSYKRVAENASLYSNEVRERVAYMKGSVDNVKILQEQLDAQKRELDMLTVKLPSKEKDFLIAKDLFTKKQAEVQSLDKKRLERMSKEKEFSLFEEKIKGIKSLISSLEKQKESYSKQFATFEVKKVEFDPSKKDKFKEVINQLREKRKILHGKFGNLSARRDQANVLVDKISSLTLCPTCKQDVSDNHKHKIKSDQDAILKDVLELESRLKTLQSTLDSKEREVLDKQDKYLELERDFLLSKSKLEQKNNISNELIRIENQLTTQNDLLKVTSSKLIISKEELDKLPVIDTSKDRLELDVLAKDERLKELEFNEFKTKITLSNRQLDVIIDSLNKKKEIQSQIDHLSLLRSWNIELFIPLVKVVEKRVMLKVYNEFNHFFQKWFDMLLEDETITVRLDEDFNPLVEQNGFDTTLANLSGGEKTSVALAYRLALNKVLNDYFGTIHTKGLLILDEPTDGFSAQQLDKLRDVLNELNVNQLIIVSHEAKLDSLAKEYIRIEKSEQVSKVVSSSNYS